MEEEDKVVEYADSRTLLLEVPLSSCLWSLISSLIIL